MLKKYRAALITLLVIVLIGITMYMTSGNEMDQADQKVLDLPTRLQWENDNGYCGETAIQTAALYFGTYLSQDLARQIAGEELIVSENDDELLNALKLNFEEWDWEAPTPQYEDYLVWVKQHLYEEHPVLITVYVKGMEDPDYDHIVPAVGYKAADVDSYNEADELIFNDLAEKTPFTRTFDTMWDDRSMQRNDSKYKYCIPKDVEYGTAVTGISDPNNETVPVSLEVDAWDEPNVTLGEEPREMEVKVHIKSLTPGAEYVLLKYTDCGKVPDSEFLNSAADRAEHFTADESTMIIDDSIMSNSLAIYRCVRADQ